LIGAEIIATVVAAAVIGAGAWMFRVFKRGLIAYLNAQFTPNGGNSVADRIDRLEKSVSLLTERAKETGCLPGCPRLHAYQPMPMAAHSPQWTHDVYGWRPISEPSIPPVSQPSIPMPSFVPPTSSMTPETMR